jgi:hypothetical protein|tara:strand:- start:3738 stop:4025 length:288 start_codon:yes stop_codon:yes gene_type:complete
MMNPEDLENWVTKLQDRIDSLETRISKLEEKKTRFKKPTICEIRAYAGEIDFEIDAATFFNHYESNGWMVGRGNRMKDWQASVRVWKKMKDSYAK